MASVKAVLRKNIAADGTYPLVIRITKDGKTSYLYLGHTLKEDDWDKNNQCVKKSYDKNKVDNVTNATRLNNLIAKRLAEANAKLIEMETNNTDTSSKAVSKAFKAGKQGTFFKQADLYCLQLENAGKFNRLSADKPRIERFKEFLKHSDINFSEIDVPLLKRFKAYLHGTRTVTERTVINHLVVIRTIYNQAIEANLVDRKYYPFGKDKIKITFPESLKIGLNAEDVKAIEIAEVGPHPNHARNLWLFSFYMAGMRISDVLRLKWSDFQDDRLYYTMGKNHKAGHVKVHAKAVAILDQYRRATPKHDLVFHDLESLSDLNDALNVQRRIKTRVRKNNEQLQKVLEKAKITKTVTMHISRHTFGNITGDQVSPQLLQKFYRHSSIKTTMGYQANFTHKDEDAALDSIIGF